MAPNDRPANENGEPVAPSRKGDWVEFVVSIVVIVGLVVFAFTVLDAAHWWSVGITIAVAVVCMIVAALYRLIVHGRA